MIFQQIALLVGVAAIFGVIAHNLKQPLLVGYVVAGIILGAIGKLSSSAEFTNLGQIGTTLLLFLVGLEMNIWEMRSLGKTIIGVGILQIVITAVLGFSLSIFLGFSTLASIYLGIAFTFSSTIIVIKLLSEKRELTSLYGKISLGILLVQDFAAIIILVVLGSLKNGQIGAETIVLLIVKSVALLLLTYVLARKILPLFYEKYIADSPELAFTISIAWALLYAAFVAGPFGFSLEIGGFLAGLALSTLPEHLHIASRTKPLRDFFLIIFFLLLGAQLAQFNLLTILLPALVFTLFVVLVKPVIVMTLLGAMKHKKRTSFLTSLTFAQVSEFSFILMTVGVSVSRLDQKFTALATLVGVLTMTISTYMVNQGEGFYSRIKDKLSLFERKIPKESALLNHDEMEEHIIIAGCDRTGRALIPGFVKKNRKVLVIDFNPQVLKMMEAQKIPYVFGDAGDAEILEEAKLEKAAAIISTIASLPDNLVILSTIAKYKRKPISIFTASTRNDAIKLYQGGASYVVVPENIAGEHLGLVLRKYLRKNHPERIAAKNFENFLAKL